MGFFAHLTTAPDDPILGLVAQFAQDPRSDKIDLTVGAYKNEQGQPENFAACHAAQLAVSDYFYNLPTLSAKKAVELGPEHNQLVAGVQVPPGLTIGYLPTAGFKPFTDAVQELVYADTQARQQGRVVTIESVAGSGGLSVTGTFLAQKVGLKRIFLSDPTWSNHYQLFGQAGLECLPYPYYDESVRGINFAKTLEFFAQNLTANDAVLFHGSCHNPTGCDFTPEQWQQVLAVLKDKGAFPVFDVAYQGFGDGLAQDVYGVRYAADFFAESICIYSCSKSFGLYGERVGAINVVCSTPEQTSVVSSNVQDVAAAVYVAPTSHGAYVVATVLTNPALRADWEATLNKISARLRSNREKLVAELEKLGHPEFAFLKNQRGMFSYTGLTAQQAQKLRKDHALYIVDNGRINVCGLTDENIATVAQRIVAVL